MLYFQTRGELTSPPIIFLHGFLGSHADYLPLLEHLKGNYFCSVVDLPAHGKSPYTAGMLTNVQKHIESIYALTKQKPFLVGYSLGGRIALQIAQAPRIPIAGIIAFSAHIGLSSESQRKKRLEADLIWQQRLKTLPKEEFLSLWYAQEPFSSLQQKPHLLQKLYQERDLSNKDDLCLILEEMSLAKQPLLTEFPFPTCLAFGEEDLKYKDLYKPLWLPKASIPKSGHAVLLENPQACAIAVADFFTNRSRSQKYLIPV